MRCSVPALVAALALCAAPVVALEFEGCTKAQIESAGDAVARAKVMTEAALDAFGHTQDYERWFGSYGTASAATVQQNLTAIDLVLGTEAITLVCNRVGREGCLVDTFANVWPDKPFVINLCPGFFEMPGIAEMTASHPGFQNGSREGTIIHELSHFTVLAGTDDECYSRRVCSSMARTEPRRAIRNADSYQYFVEDVFLGSELAKE
jgi:peptidyl-Lys metalloendopeptidase